jgi:hypothetical protein
VNALGAIDASERLRTVFAATVRTRKSPSTPTVEAGSAVPEPSGGAIAFNDGVEVGGNLSAVSAAVATKSSSESISTASLSSLDALRAVNYTSAIVSTSFCRVSCSFSSSLWSLISRSATLRSRSARRSATYFSPSNNSSAIYMRR